MRLLLLFVLTPLVELAILVYLGTIIGVLYTMLIVIATGIVGGLMARHQGMATMSRISNSIERGIIPSEELFSGLLILIGGLLLLTPGIITDIVGFTLLIPPSRRIIGRWLLGYIRRRIERAQIEYYELR